MKVALPTSKLKVDGHFGHCDYFTVYTVNKDEKSVVTTEQIAAPKGCGCSSNIAEVLAEQGVSLLLTNNIGGNALAKLNKENIEVIRGVQGTVDHVIQEWLNGHVKESLLPCIDHK